ncbi:hypothetical protein [uncultured Paraglaciecola sp.]|uniref:hypothetical protein n=1 Tax=uncultured Paraglaciecola sp. TaxID=1765024 RepID=UPI0030DBC070|tara:strand:- start:6928 stop:7746 length:819 start_codon:yes stop_codon:yes gene_type:complete
MTIIDTLSSSLKLGSVVESTSTDNSTIDGVTSSLGQVFDNLMSLMQSDESTSDDASDSEASTDELVNSIATLTDPIETIQQGLIAALGLNNFGASTLADLTSDESIASLQNAFLVSLQANLFSASDTGSDTIADGTSSISEVAESNDFIGNIENLSNAFLGDGELGLNEVFDTINILNHVPIVADIYQETMATDVAPIAEVVGSFMYGGALGLGYAVANLAVENYTGKSIYSNLLEVFFDDEQQATIESTTDALAEGINPDSDAYQFVKRTF